MLINGRASGVGAAPDPEEQQRRAEEALEKTRRMAVHNIAQSLFVRSLGKVTPENAYYMATSFVEVGLYWDDAQDTPSNPPPEEGPVVA